MWTLALRTLRFRKGGFVATFVALFFGTAIVLACGGMLETGIRNNVPPERLAGATAVVMGDRGYELHPGDPEDSEKAVSAEQVPLNGALAARLRGTPGVTRVVEDVTVPSTLLVGGGIRAGGHTWTSASLGPGTLRSGRPPAGPGQVVLDAGTAGAADAGVGDTVRIAAHGGTAPYRISGITEPGAAPSCSSVTAKRCGSPAARGNSLPSR